MQFASNVGAGGYRDEADIACEIDKLDYLQVISECRGGEPMPAHVKAKITDVTGFRMFKGNWLSWI